MLIIKPPVKLPDVRTIENSVFLGGSIDMGTCEDWQTRISNELLQKREGLTILNPRRDNWDSSWKQVPENREFSEQVNWELDAQCKASVILYYFAPGSKSPITLFELGLFKNNNVVVYCPRDFYRYGNVAIVCDRYYIPRVESEDEVVELVLNELSWVNEQRPY